MDITIDCNEATVTAFGQWNVRVTLESLDKNDLDCDGVQECIDPERALAYVAIEMSEREILDGLDADAVKYYAKTELGLVDKP